MEKTIEQKFEAICAELLATVPTFQSRHDYAWMSTENEGNSYTIHVGVNSYYFDASKGPGFYRTDFYLLIYAGMGFEARDAVQAEWERIQPLIDCIGNTQFMYKCYLDSKDETNRFNLSDSIGKLGRAKTKYQKGGNEA